jgi:Phage integrase family
MTKRAGIGHWHAHEGRHTAVSIMSSNGVPLQEISDTVGHKSTHVTETVYRHVIVPAIRGGATVMDQVFGRADAGGDEPGTAAATPLSSLKERVGVKRGFGLRFRGRYGFAGHGELTPWRPVPGRRRIR